MSQRRFFATRVKGVRLDATANGVRMGQTVGHRAGTITFRIDLDRGAGWYGKPVNVQVLATGPLLPTVLDSREFAVPAPNQPVVEFDVPFDAGEDGTWIVLRFTDPEAKAEETGPDGAFAEFGRSFAYASPFYIDPDTVRPAAGRGNRPRPVGRNPAHGRRGPGGPGAGSGASPAARTLPATGGGSWGVVGGAAAMALSGLIGLRTRGAHRHDSE